MSRVVHCRIYQVEEVHLIRNLQLTTIFFAEFYKQIGKNCCFDAES